MAGSFESVRWNACVHRLDLGLYSHPKEFWGIESEPILIPREKSPLRRLRGGSNPRRCITQNSEPNNTLPTELFRPLFPFLLSVTQSICLSVIYLCIFLSSFLSFFFLSFFFFFFFFFFSFFLSFILCVKPWG